MSYCLGLTKRSNGGNLSASSKKGVRVTMSFGDPVVIAVSWSVTGLAVLFTLCGWCAQQWTSSLIQKYETMCFCGKTATVTSIILSVVVTVPVCARVLIPPLNIWVLTLTSLITFVVGAVSIIVGSRYFDKQPLWVYEVCCHLLAPVCACLLLNSLLINLIRALVSLVR